MSAFDERMKDVSWAFLNGQLDDAWAACDDADEVASTSAQRAAVLEGRANVLIKQARFAEAEKRLRAAIDLFGASVPASTWGNLGFALDKLEAYDEAVVAHSACIASHTVADGVTHPRTLRKLADLAWSLTGLGRLDEAEALLRRMVDGFASQPEREPVWFAQALSKLGYFLLRSRRDPEAALVSFDRAEALRDACSLRSPKGAVLREGFPESFAEVLAGNRAAALAALGRPR